MYHAGSQRLGLRPEECLFVDDDLELVTAADALGYRGIAMVRDATPPPGMAALASLDELPPLLEGTATIPT